MTKIKAIKKCKVFNIIDYTNDHMLKLFTKIAAGDMKIYLSKFKN
jgi:hypothetical protein